MSRFESDSGSTVDGDSELKSALGTVERTIARHDLTAKFLVAALVSVAFGILVRTVATSHLGNTLGSLLVWFTLIFVVGFGTIGVGIKTWGAIQRRRRGRT